MAVVDIQRLSALEDLTVGGVNGDVSWTPGRLSALRMDGQDYLVIGGGNLGGIGVASFAKNGRIDFLDAFGTRFEPFGDIELRGQGVVAHKVGASHFVYGVGGGTFSGGSNYHVSIVNFDDPEAPQLVQRIDDPRATGEAGINGGFDPVVISSKGQDYLVVSPGYDDILHTYRIKQNGELGPVIENTMPYSLSDGYTTATYGKASFVVSFGYFRDAPIQVMKLQKNGTLKQTFSLQADSPEIFNQQTKGIASAVVGDRSFIFASEVTRGAIMVYEMDKTGALTVVDKIFPGIGDSWGAPEGLETFQHDGETYLLAGGYGSSLGVFKVAEGGSLIEVDEFGAGVASTGRVVDTQVIQIGDQTFFAATTLSSAPLASYRFVPTDEEISGSNGKNRLEGTEADDQIYAKGGNDRVEAGEGDDLIEGGSGNDVLFGEDGHDDIYGGDGKDSIKGGLGDEFIFGEGGKDVLRGEAGHDYLSGGADRDRLFGDVGNDRLLGGGGRDNLFGGDGNDRLTDGGGANDKLRGGAGADLFILVNDGKRDIILDYEDGVDQIDLRAESPTLFTDLNIRAQGDSLVVSYKSGSVLIHGADGPLRDFELGESDFIFT